MKRSALFLLGLVFGAFACGGGSGGSEMAFYGGVWYGDASLVEDTCEAPAEPYIFYTHLVNQNDSNVVIDNGAMAFQGTAEERGAMVATASRPYRGTLAGIAGCVEEITWRYEEIEENSAQFVVRTSRVTCTSEAQIAQCQVVHTGSAFRSDPNNVVPIPVYEGAVSDTQI